MTLSPQGPALGGWVGAGAAAAGAGSPSGDAAALAGVDRVLLFRASEYEVGGRESNPHSPGASQSGGDDHRPLGALEQRGMLGGAEQEKEGNENTHAETRGRGNDDADEELVVDEPPGLMPPPASGGGGGDGGNYLEPLEILVKRQPPLPLIEEAVVQGEDGKGGGQGVGDGRGDRDADDNDDGRETSFDSISRRASRSFGDVHKRASTNVVEQVSPRQGGG